MSGEDCLGLLCAYEIASSFDFACARALCRTSSRTSWVRCLSHHRFQFRWGVFSRLIIFPRNLTIYLMILKSTCSISLCKRGVGCHWEFANEFKQFRFLEKLVNSRLNSHSHPSPYIVSWLWHWVGVVKQMRPSWPSTCTESACFCSLHSPLSFLKLFFVPALFAITSDCFNVDVSSARNGHSRSQRKRFFDSKPRNWWPCHGIG